jgi:hypothetical protein
MHGFDFRSEQLRFVLRGMFECRVVVFAIHFVRRRIVRAEVRFDERVIRVRQPLHELGHRQQQLRIVWRSVSGRGVGLP